MAERPKDIPAAMRDAFTTPRISSAWEMVALATDNDRMAALNGFERLLSARGLTLRDIADVLTQLPSKTSAAPSAPTTPGASAYEQAFSGFGDIFSQMSENARRREAEARPQPAPKRNCYVQGADVPVQISGNVVIQDERPTRGGSMIVFTVEHNFAGTTTVYGPIVAFSKVSREMVSRAANPSSPSTLGLKIRPPKQVGHMPSVETAWFA